MKLFNKVSYIFILLLVITCIFGNFIYASTAYDIGEYVIESTIKKNGDLHVVEDVII